MWKKKISWLLIIAMLGITTAGCGKNEEKTVENTEKTEKVKLRLMSISTDENQITILEDYIKKNLPERFPNLEVEFEQGGGGEDNANKMKTYNAAGNLPDVWYSTTDSAISIIRAGNMLDLTEYVKKDGFLRKYNQPESLKHSDGKIYTLSSGADTYFTPRIFYHKDIFKAYGLQIPETFDEFIDICNKLKGKGIVPMSITGKGGWASQIYLIQTMIQGEDPQVVLDLLRNKTDFSNPKILEAVKKIEWMVQEGIFPRGVANLDYGPSVEMFLSKQTAMFGGMSWEVSNFSENENIGMFMWPTSNSEYTAKDVTQYWGSPLNGYAVNPNSKHVELAVEFAEYCVEQEALFYAEQGTMLNLQTGIKAGTTTSLMRENIESYENAEIKLPTLLLHAMDTKTATEYGSLGANLLTGNYSAEMYVEEFNKAWKENTWFEQ